MPIKIIENQYGAYPSWQHDGNAARFAIPFAREVCKGNGLDIGCGKKEWSFPDAVMVDPKITTFHSTHLPEGPDPAGWDYIFSSHCLEHLDDWVGALDHWYECLKRGGVLFLYLPDYDSQNYWRPWNNRKHKSAFTPEIISDYLQTKFIKVMVSGSDLNSSFVAMGEK